MSFEEAGKQNGLEIWRIEDFEAVPYPKEKYGKFHVGDSYIVLSTTNADSKHPIWSVHYWLGEETTPDEYGTAAFKAFELDDTLGGAPILYREVREHESGLFRSFFKKGIKYLPGGVASGLTDVDAEPVEKRLFEVKGKRNIKIRQVNIEGANVCKSDCWILDQGKDGKILVYMPPGASKMEQCKARHAANQIRDEDHAGSATVEILSEQCGDNCNQFFEALGISADDVAESSKVDNAESENATAREVKLHMISDASGELEITEVSGMPLTQDMLNAQQSGEVSRPMPTPQPSSPRNQYHQELVSSEEEEDRKQPENDSKHGGKWWKREETSVEYGDDIDIPLVMQEGEYTCLVGEDTEDVYSMPTHFRRKKSDEENTYYNLDPRPAPSPSTHEKKSDCFILDTGKSGGDAWSGIFVWIGKQSTKEEKVGAMKKAEGYLANNNLPKWTKIMRVSEGCETTMFKQYFKTWKDPEDSDLSTLGQTFKFGSTAEWDVSQLHEEQRKLIRKSGGAAIGFYPDDGSGQKEIFRIENMDMVPITDDKICGRFFGGDSYVIRYSYKNSEGRDAYIVYFWQGNESTQDEKAASAFNAVKLDDEVGGKAIQVRVVQGMEPRHFIKMFGGKMIVYSGGKATGFKNREEEDSYDVDGTSLFRVRGTCPEDVMTTQIQPECPSSLYTDDVFILESPSKTWIWAGRDSYEDEVNYAKAIASIVSPKRDVESIADGSEPDDFWEALGGKGDPTAWADEQQPPILEPRLFHCKISPVSEKFRAYQIFNFEQDDMVEDDVMILDSGDEVYVWLGNDSDVQERKEALKLAKNYIDTDPTERNSTNTLIFTINQGEEPGSFTQFFPKWEQNYNTSNCDHDIRCQSIEN